MLRRQVVPAIVLTLLASVVFGLAYPLLIYGVGQLAFERQADGSLITRGGRVVASSLLGQRFSSPSGRPLAQYFQPRPSAAGSGYDATASGATNLGPSDPRLLTAVSRRAGAYRAFNGLAASAPVPVDAVTSSASGLDPDISIANADLQASRVARARKLPLAVVLQLVHRYTSPRALGFLGEARVNVVELNLALDEGRR